MIKDQDFEKKIDNFFVDRNEHANKFETLNNYHIKKRVLNNKDKKIDEKI